MKNRAKSSAFTLVEMMVSMTIFSLIMVSVFTVFIYNTTMSAKVEIERSMQENVKSVLDTLREDIQVWEIYPLHSLEPRRLTVWDAEYYLALKEDDTFTPQVWDTDILECWTLANTCYFMKKDTNGSYPLSNSFTAFENLQFHVTDVWIPKVTITFTARPAAKKWVGADLIKNSKVPVQTTFTKRIINFQ